MNTTEDNLTTEQKDEQWIQDTDRFDKMEYLLECCSKEHLTECTFLNEIVRWMDEDQFDEFFKRHCQLWDILLPAELEERMNS